MSADPAALLAEVRTWSPKAQQEFAARIDRATGRQRRIWYCSRGRACDGEPHDDLTYRHCRDDQYPPAHNHWLTWMLRGGRGSGKTRTASEFTRYAARHVPAIACLGLDVRKIRQTMIEGRSGLIRICENAGIDYTWEPSKREFTFESGPGSGCRAYMYSMEEPDSLRSPEHGFAWADEPSHAPLIEDCWRNLKFGLRIPGMPGGAKIIATSTPLPNAWTKALDADPRTVSVAVATYRNLANLDPQFAEAILAEYEGTRLGRQELYGEILDDVIGALWTNEMIVYVPADERAAVIAALERVVVSVDPAGSVDPKRDETGIIVVGLIGDTFYVLEDSTGHYTPHGWGTEAVRLANKWGAESIVAERNYGGQMVEHTIKTVDEGMRVRTVHSRRGKALRAEPVVARYEQSRVRHLEHLEDLESEQTSWVPGSGPSPNRVDALVHGITELGGGARVAAIGVPNSIIIPSRAGLRR